MIETNCINGCDRVRVPKRRICRVCLRELNRKNHRKRSGKSLREILGYHVRRGSWW